MTDPFLPAFAAPRSQGPVSCPTCRNLIQPVAGAPAVRCPFCQTVVQMAPAYGAPPAGYPPAGYPPQQPGYPPQQMGYPPQQAGYPPVMMGKIYSPPLGLSIRILTCVMCSPCSWSNSRCRCSWISRSSWPPSRPDSRHHQQARQGED